MWRRLRSSRTPPPAQSPWAGSRSGREAAGNMMEMTMINETDDADGDLVGVYVDGVLQNAVADGYYHG
jgi:hypothetical protein